MNSRRYNRHIVGVNCSTLMSILQHANASNDVDNYVDIELSQTDTINSLPSVMEEEQNEFPTRNDDSGISASVEFDERQAINPPEEDVLQTHGVNNTNKDNIFVSK